MGRKSWTKGIFAASAQTSNPYWFFLEAPENDLFPGMARADTNHNSGNLLNNTAYINLNVLAWNNKPEINVDQKLNKSLMQAIS